MTRSSCTELKVALSQHNWAAYRSSTQREPRSVSFTLRRYHEAGQKMLSQSGSEFTRPTNQQDAENAGRRARGPIRVFCFSVFDGGRLDLDRKGYRNVYQ
jgi:hypothetical protein